jgi:PAS domain S-box-containing protein
MSAVTGPGLSTPDLASAAPAGAGEMAARVRSFDWSNTPLGPMESWPQALKAAVGICLNSRFPMFVWWGPQLVNIYNDAYVPILGKRHPQALGRPARASWGEIWDVVGPQADAVMLRGEASWNERVLLVMERHGYTEDTWFTWSYSPIIDDSGAIGGLFCACYEETQRVLAERERDRLTRQRQLALDAAKMGWWHYDPATRVASWDARYAEIFGIPRGSGGGDEALATLHPDDDPRIRAAVRAAINPADPKPYSVVGRVVRPDGSVRWVESHGSATFEGEGPQRRATSFVGTVADVTDRRRADEQAKVILESITDAFFALDRQWRFTYVNRQAERVLNRAPGDLLGKVIWDEYPGLRGSEFERVYLGAGLENAAASVTNYYPDHDRWYEVHAYPAPEGISVYFRDATEAKRAEAAVRASEQQMRLLTDALPALVGYIDRDLCFRFSNKAYSEWFGQPPEWLRGRHLREVLGEETYRDRGPLIEAALRGQSVRFEARAVHRERGPVEVEAVYTPDVGPDGTVNGFVSLVQDITQRKAAEAERERLLANERAARAEAERASEAKSQFLATLSHELRTPLTPVLLTVSLMEMHPGLPDELREDVATIRRNVELESRLIADLLDLTRIASGKMQLESEDVDLHRVVRAAIDICQREASARLVVELGAGAHRVRGDPTRLQQIFWNIVSNAAKFTGPDGLITVTSEDSPGGRVRVSVSDTGAGIDPAVLPKLFNAFEQGDVRAGRLQAGLGLGLAISRRLAEAHGGTISAHSEGRGRGATFTVELPALDAPTTVPAPQQPGGATSSGRPMHVLVVEDHAPTLTVMTKLLRTLGHRVTGATTVAAATAAARQDGFDLIISDLGLPDGSGLDVMRQVREKYAGRAIALTGYGMESDVAASRDAGFTEHLTKPVDLAALEAAIRRVASDAK